MASSNKAQDPAAAALLAIEEALNLRASRPKRRAGRNTSKSRPALTSRRGVCRQSRKRRLPRPEPSRRPRDSMRPPEPTPAAIDEDRLFAPARANSAQGEEKQVSGANRRGPLPSYAPGQRRPSIGGRDSSCLSEPATTGVRRSSLRPVRFCGSSCRSAILSPTALSFSIFRRGPCCLRRHSPS